MAIVLGNIEKFKGTGLVAFLDILGFSQQILNNWDNEKNNPLNKLLELKRNLPVYKEDDIHKYEKGPHVRTYVCRVQTISDSIIVSFGFQDNPKVGDVVLGTIAFLQTIAAIWRNTIEAGFTLRGAADFGEIYWNEKEIIGPAFVNAHSLEQSHAKTSRIVLSSMLNRNIANMYNQAQSLWNHQLCRLLRKDIDGYIILNPHLLYQIPGNQDLEQLLYKLGNMQNNACGMNKEKYSPLLAALNSNEQNLKEDDIGRY